MGGAARPPLDPTDWDLDRRVRTMDLRPFTCDTITHSPGALRGLVDTVGSIG